MAHYRQIHTEIWSDPWFEELGPADKLLFIYLFSNKRTNIIGLYDISVRVIVFESGLTTEQITAALERFERAEKVYYEDGTVWIPKMPLRNANNLASPKTQANIKSTLRAAKDTPLARRCLEYFNGILAPRYGIDTLSIPHLHNIAYHNTSQHSNGADAPPVEDEPETTGEPETPVNFEQWLTLVEYPPDGSNRHAQLLRMHNALFPGRDPPSYGLIGKTVKQVGGAGYLARLMWEASLARATGDIMPYCMAAAKNKKGGRREKGNNGDGITIQGHTPKPADPSEFYDDG